jgi:fructuronate reductase
MRLSLSTLELVPSELRPALDPSQVEVGIVHLGIGAFHRAHQAVYTELAMAGRGEHHWGITGVTQRNAAARDLLAPQDGLYTVVAQDHDRCEMRVVGAVREVLDGPSEAAEATARIASPQVSVVTLTVTEKAYRLDPRTGRLDRHDPAVLADAAGAPPSTVIGRLVAGLRQRQRNDAGPLTVICCDNLTQNGTLMRTAVEDFCDLLPDGDGLRHWVGEHLRFPSSMVDRIVPTATDGEASLVQQALGVHDAAAVATEPFRQWVLEDAFAGPRPAWESAGALIVDDVTPYELLKLRTLNASHSLLAYLGGLAGIRTIADAVHDDDLQGAVLRLVHHEVAPTLPPVPGVDFEAYVGTLLQRFANPKLCHTTGQVASDGSQKLGQRLLGTIERCYAVGITPRAAELTVAAWLRQVLVARDDLDRVLNIADPAAEAMREAVATSPASRAVQPALAAAGFPDVLLENAEFVDNVGSWLDTLDRHGAVAAAKAISRPPLPAAPRPPA